MKMSAKKTILTLLALSLLLLVVSVSGVYAVSISQVGSTASARGWLFSQSTPFGIYYGFGTNENTYPFSDIYYFDFLTQKNSVIKSGTADPLVWSDVLYSTIIGDKIFIANFYNPYKASEGYSYDGNGLYAIDTKTNTFYLYDKLPFDFFVDNWPSPMAAVGTDLYFFVGIPDRPDIARRVYRYSPATKLAVALAELPSDVGAGGIVHAAGSKIYITTYKYWEENSIYTYDTLTDKFTLLATDKLIPSNNYRSNSVINGKLYFVGGEDPLKGDNTDTNSVDSIVEYDPATNLFGITGTLSYGLLGASTTSVGGNLYVVGGEVHSDPEVSDKITAIEIVSKDLATTIAEFLCNYYPANVCAEHFLTSKSYKNSGGYISYVAQKTNEFLSNSLITGKEKGMIMSAATKLAAAIKKK